MNKVTILPNHYLSTGVVNNGCTVYHAINGKNIMGTARPGNNSGNLISRGRETDIGIITAAKERMENKKLNMIVPVLFSHFKNAQYIKPATRQMMIQ